MTTRLIILCLTTLLAMACDSQKSREDEKIMLDKTLEEIMALSTSVPCTTASICRWVGLGSKPCGGPQSYLLYPSSVDTILLLDKVSKYNAAQSAFNKKWSLISDCSVVSPPDSAACVKGKCVAYPN
ncbi:MAG: hypothetical protein JNL40_06030 [Cyclobacteriaceae bacterium]|nr:hypothetical protein [Cyclobacteriaceae bacterium]